MALVLQGKMTKSEFTKHKKKCSVQPNAHLQGKDKFKYGRPEPPFDIYRITQKGILFPKYYAFENVKNYQHTHDSVIQEISLPFSGTLRPHQIKSINCIKQSYEKCGGALLCLGCGLGKTVVANYIISEMKVKTVVLVHKEFLLNQWRERINTFLPNAKIGRVQGKVKDVKNKDIILVMLQTIAMKDFESDLFSNVGQLIVDECHHIAARVFCNAMFKIPVKYTLGLSATPQRKDGLEYVIHWFLGPTVLTMENISENKVEVHIKHFDLEYPDEEYNKSGKLSLPNMITNLSLLEERNDKLVDITMDILNNDNSRKILILSERRQQLKNLQALFNAINVACGLYIGGMKETELKNAESKQIMLSTYAMTSEGFDNPSLNTLIFATPKTNIEQSVGRILRKVHDINPIIIDIIDNYSLFKIQGYQRTYFYKNKHYKLIKDNLNKEEDVHQENNIKLSEYAFDD